MTPLVSTSPSFSPLLVPQYSISPVSYTPLVQRLRELNVLDENLETKLLSEFTTDVLSESAIERLNEILKQPYCVTLTDGVFQERSLAELISLIAFSYEFTPKKIEIVGSYVHKILGWEFVLSLFKKVNIDLKAVLPTEEYEKCKENYERAPNDIDVRVYLEDQPPRIVKIFTNEGEITRKITLRDRLHESLSAFLAGTMQGIPVLHPYVNIDDFVKNNHFFISGFQSPTSVPAEILWIEGEKLGREELFVDSGMMIKVPFESLQAGTEKPSWDSREESPIKRVTDRFTLVNTLRDPHMVDKKGWGKLLVEMYKGYKLSDPGAEAVLLSNACSTLLRNNPIDFIKTLILHPLPDSSPETLLSFIKLAISSIQRCRGYINVPNWSKASTVELVGKCFPDEVLRQASLYELEDKDQLAKLQLAELLFESFKKTTVSKEVIDYVKKIIPSLENMGYEYSPLKFLVFLLSVEGWRFCAWRLYCDKNIKEVIPSKFLLGCMRASYVEGFKIVEEASKTLKDEELKESIDYIFANFPRNEPAVMFSLSVSFLAQRLKLLKEETFQKFQGCEIAGLVYREAAAAKITVPDFVAVDAFLNLQFTDSFADQALKSLEQKRAQDPLFALKDYKALIASRKSLNFFRLFLLLDPLVQLDQAELLFKEYLDQRVDLFASPKLLERVRPLLLPLSKGLEVKTFLGFIIRLPVEEKIEYLLSEKDRLKDTPECLLVVKEVVETLLSKEYEYKKHSTLLALFESYTLCQNPEDIQFWIKTFQLFSKGKAARNLKEIVSTMWVNRRIEFIRLGVHNSDILKVDQLFLEFCQEYSFPLLLTLSDSCPLTSMTENLEGKRLQRVAQLVLSNLLPHLKDEASLMKFKKTAFTLSSQSGDYEYLQKHYIKTESLPTFIELLRRVMNCSEPLIIDTIKEALRFIENEEVSLLLLSAIKALKLDASIKAVAWLIRNESHLFAQATLEGYFVSLQGNKDFFPFYKKVLLSNWEQTFSTTFLGEYFTSTEGRSAVNSKMQELLTDSTLFPQLPNFMAWPVINDDNRLALFTYLASNFYDCSASFTARVQLSKMAYALSSLAVKQEMRKRLVSFVDFNQVPQVPEDESFSFWIRELGEFFMLDSNETMTGNFFQKLMSFTLNEMKKKLEKIDLDQRFFTLVIAGLDNALPSKTKISQNTKFLTLESWSDCPLNQYTLTQNQLDCPVGEVYEIIAKKVTIKPQLIEPKHQPIYYEQMGALLDLCLDNMDSQHPYCVEIADFITFFFHTHLENVIKQPENARRIFLSIFERFFIFTFHRFEMHALHMSNCRGLMEVMKLLIPQYDIYNGLQKQRGFACVYLCKSYQFETSFVVTNLHFISAFNRASEVILNSFKTNKAARPVIFYQLMFILKNYSKAYFSKQTELRDKLAHIVTASLQTMPELYNCRHVQFIDILAAFLPPITGVEQAYSIVERSEMLTLAIAYKEMGDAHRKNGFTVQPYHTDYSLLKLKVFAYDTYLGALDHNPEMWMKGCKDHFREMLKLVEGMPEKYPGQFCRWFHCLAQVITLSHDLFLTKPQDYFVDYKMALFEENLTVLCNSSLSKPDKLKYLSYMLDVAEAASVKDKQWDMQGRLKRKVLELFSDYDLTTLLSSNEEFLEKEVFNWLNE